MSHKLNKSTFTLTIGATALAGTLLATTATANPFEMDQLSSGYQIGLQGDSGAKGAEGKCGEGKCGGTKPKADKNTEGKCGGAKPDSNKSTEGKCGGAKPDSDKGTEGKCGGNN